MGLKSKQAGGVLLVLACAVIGFATLLPWPPDPRPAGTVWWCLTCGPVRTAELLLNVALFVPLGLGLGLHRWRGAAAMSILVAVPAGIELLQATLIGGRDGNVRDVILNAAGGGIGLLIATAYETAPPRRSGRVIATIGLGVLIALLGIIVMLYLLVLGGAPLAPPPGW